MARRNPLRSPAWRGVFLGLACALLVWGLFRGSALLHGVEDWMLDACFFYRGERPTAAKIVIIGIDDVSLSELRKPLASLSPELARVVTHVHKQGASAIGIDLIVPAELRDRPEFKRGAEGDAGALGDAVDETGKVVLAQWWDGKRMQLSLPQWCRKAVDDETRDPHNRDLGFINMTPDDDQFLRHQRLLQRIGERVAYEKVPAFVLALYARFCDSGYDWDDEQGVIRVGGQVIPLDAEQQLRINFAGPPGRFTTLSFVEVLKTARRGDALPAVKGAVVKARFIHFATHGELGKDKTPQPRLVLGQIDNDEKEEMGGPNDGFLTLPEVTFLQLNAQVVVLSACETGKGKFDRGEGVSGLARTFLYAGSKGVVCSLWSVDDARTAELMADFYKGLKDEKPTGEALRAAQLKMIERGRAPFFWAPFILMGE